MKFGNKLYYSNEQTDEVLTFKSTNRKIDKTYKYINKNPFYCLWSFFTYRVLATPIVWFYYTFIKKVKFINKRVLKSCKKGGYFIYANHSSQFSDAFCPALICFPKKPHIVVNPDNISLPFIGKCLKMWGALPTPNTLTATKNFNKAISFLLTKNKPILIYPEAHLWPYYTKIRNFNSSAFRYPVINNKPVFTFTTVHKLKRATKKPKLEIYIDGPFFPESGIHPKEAQIKLRNTVYNQLCMRSKNSNYEYVKYIRRKND